MTLTNEAMYDWWDGAAKCNAMHAILSNRQDWDAQEFFKTGDDWLASAMQFVGHAGVKLGGEVALDFGCGLGRMTHALLAHYRRAIGIDISDEMIRQAREHAGGKPLEYIQVPQAPLPLPDRSVDLSFSTIVLQHIPPPHCLTMVHELFRVSRSAVLFDVPSHKLHPDDPEPGPGIFLLGIEHVRGAAASHGFDLIALRNFPATATRQYQYLFMR